jgi:hypothetical protein
MLIFLQILFILLLSFQIFLTAVQYINEGIPLALIIPALIYIFYIKLLYTSYTLYQEEKIVKAYFYTIGGFFIVTFIQIGSCTAISPIIISGH